MGLCYGSVVYSSSLGGGTDSAAICDGLNLRSCERDKSGQIVGCIADAGILTFAHPLNPVECQPPGPGIPVGMKNLARS